MKPFPDPIQRLYPCAPDRLPDRPWWRRIHQDVRSSALLLRQDFGEQKLPVWSNNAESYDREHPIPYPGHRPGQMWCNAHGQVFWVMYAAHDAASYLGVEVTGAAVHVLSLFSPENDAGIHVAGSVKQAKTVTYFVQTALELYPYLIADPACPHLAPWAPKTDVVHRN